MVSDTDVDTEKDFLGPPTKPRNRRRRYLVIGAAVVVGAGLAAGGLVLRTHLDHARAQQDAAARVAVLAAGDRDISEVTQVDYRDTAAMRHRWLAASTGTLHNSFTSSGASLARQIELGHVITSGRVTSATVTALDRTAGTASMTASVAVELSYADAPMVTRNDQIEANLALTTSGWKLTSMSGISVVGH